jgi:pilus assembly protein CpaC
MSTFRTRSASPLAPTVIVLAIGAALAAMTLAQAAPARKAAARAAPAELAKTPRTDLAPQLTLVEGKSSLLRLPYPSTKMSVGDPRITDIIPLNKSELYLVGKTAGSTNLIVWSKTGDATIIDIVVQMDIAPLMARIAQLLPGEKDVKVLPAADSIIVSGTVSDVVKADQVLALALAYVQRNARSDKGGKSEKNAAGGPSTETGNSSTAGAIGGAVANKGEGNQQSQARVINMLSIAAPQQVMLEVKVAEISKTLVDQFGVSMGASTKRGSLTYTFLTNLLAGVPAVGDAFNKNGNFLTLDAQKRDGLVKVLAEPTIMAISGQEASFLAGGKIFIPVSVNSGAEREIKLEEKEFGIAVKFTPTVLDGGRINLKVAPEVSDLNKDGIGITAAGVSGTAILPSFTTRRATTTVQLYDGQSFAIGGLIKNNVTTNIKAFPVLGEIPVLGALFRSSDFQTDRTELVFIVTPHLVKPLAADYKLPTDGYIQPSRGEFFLKGRLEGGGKEAPSDSAAAPSAAAAGATGFDLK